MKIFNSYRKLSWFPRNVIRKSISLNVTYSIILHNSTCYIPLDRENGVFKIINSPRNSRIKKIFFNISNYFEIIYYLYYTNRVRFTEIHTHAPPRKCIYVNQIYISGDKTFKFLVSLSIEAISSPLKLAQKNSIFIAFFTTFTLKGSGGYAMKLHSHSMNAKTVFAHCSHFTFSPLPPLRNRTLLRILTKDKLLRIFSPKNPIIQ